MYHPFLVSLPRSYSSLWSRYNCFCCLTPASPISSLLLIGALSFNHHLDVLPAHILFSIVHVHLFQVASLCVCVFLGDLSRQWTRTDTHYHLPVRSFTNTTCSAVADAHAGVLGTLTSLSLPPVAFVSHIVCFRARISKQSSTDVTCVLCSIGDL